MRNLVYCTAVHVVRTSIEPVIVMQQTQRHTAASDAGSRTNAGERGQKPHTIVVDPGEAPPWHHRLSQMVVSVPPDHLAPTPMTRGPHPLPRRGPRHDGLCAAATAPHYHKDLLKAIQLAQDWCTVCGFACSGRQLAVAPGAALYQANFLMPKH